MSPQKINKDWLPKTLTPETFQQLEPIYQISITANKTMSAFKTNIKFRILK